MHPQQWLLQHVGFHSMEEAMEIVHKHNFNSCISGARGFLFRQLVLVAAQTVPLGCFDFFVFFPLDENLLVKNISLAETTAVKLLVVPVGVFVVHSLSFMPCQLLDS